MILSRVYLHLNLQQEYFKLFELHEIMRQKESKVFAEILNRFKEGKHKWYSKATGEIIHRN